MSQDFSHKTAKHDTGVEIDVPPRAAITRLIRKPRPSNLGSLVEVALVLVLGIALVGIFRGWSTPVEHDSHPATPHSNVQPNRRDQSEALSRASAYVSPLNVMASIAKQAAFATKGISC